MKTRLFYLLPFSLVVVIWMVAIPTIFVKADDPTPTATRVTYPTNWINNPGDEIGYLGCPDFGNPAGWGEVTPDPLWMQVCAQCVDAYTFTTPTPHNTEVATATVTLTPTTSPYNWLDCDTGTCLLDTLTEVKLSKTYGWDVKADLKHPTSTPTNFYLHAYGTLQVTCGQSPYDGNIVIQWKLDTSYIKNQAVPGSSYHCSSRYQVINIPIDYYANASLVTTYSLKMSMDFVEGNHYLATYGGTAIYVLTVFPITMTATPQPTVGATSTPDLSGYCASVNGGGGDGSGYDTFPEVEPFLIWGDESCINVVPEKVIDTFGLTGTIPSLEVCWQEVSFNEMEVFGVLVNPMILIYSLLGIAVISWIFTT